MKKYYTMTLDEEKVERLREWLKIKGLSLSGYFNSMIDEQVNALEMVSNLKKVTSSNLLKVAGEMVKNLNKELKDGKQTKKK